MSTDRAWMYRKNDREGFLSKDYIVAMDGFLDCAYASEGDVERKTMPNGIVLRIRCPCARCKNLHHRERDEVRLHLMKYGFMLDYTIWYAHGERHHLASQNKVRNTAAFRCQSRVAGTNRAYKFKGVSSKYTGGSISTEQHRVRLRDEWGREPTDAELYERLHTSNKNPVPNVTGPPMNPPPKMAKTVKTYVRVEETCVGSNFNTVPLDDPELSVDSVGSRHKGRLSGFHTDKDPKFAKTGDPNAISSTKRSSYDSQSVEVNALKEKLASCEDQLKTEKRRRLDLEQQHKETADELARQKALIQQFCASMKQIMETSPLPRG